MTLTEMKDLLAFCKKHGVTQIRVSAEGAFEAVIQSEFAAAPSFGETPVTHSNSMNMNWEE